MAILVCVCVCDVIVCVLVWREGVGIRREERKEEGDLWCFKA